MRRRIAALTLVAAAACGLLGCGGSSNEQVQATAAAVANAAGRTADRHSGHIEMTMHLTLGGKDATIGATGGYDNQAKTFTMTMDLAPLATLGGAQSAAASSLLGGSIELRSVGGTTYMRLPALTRLLGGKGTDWAGFTAASGGSSPFGGATADPSAFLDYLRGAGGTVEDKGHEQVRGVDTTHLSTTFAPRDALANAPEKYKDQVQGALDSLGNAHTAFLDTPLPVEIYVDADGLVRRFEMALTLPIAGQSLDGKLQIDFFDFGSSVVVEAPPADQVTDLTALFKSLVPSSHSSSDSSSS